MNKALYSILCLLVSFSLYGHSNPPSDSLQIENIVITHPTSKWKSDGEVTIVLNKGMGSYTYYLSTTPAPTKDEDFIKKLTSDDHQSTFSGLDNGIYYIIVTGKDEKFVIQRVVLNHKSNK